MARVYAAAYLNSFIFVHVLGFVDRIVDAFNQKTSKAYTSPPQTATPIAHSRTRQKVVQLFSAIELENGQNLFIAARAYSLSEFPKLVHIDVQSHDVQFN